MRGATIGEEFKAANFIQDAGARCGANLIFEIVGDDESALRGIGCGFRFEDADAAAATSNARGGV